jgi:putative membrane-bound dehydrogenase-like protein
MLATLVLRGFLPVSGQAQSPDAAAGPAGPLSAGPDFSAEMPKITPRSLEESLQSLRLKAGFHAELVASEPLVRSPVAMEFDEFGRAFVVELPEYNQYGSPKPLGKGAIKLLEDTDGDGTYDKATVYAADLEYPTAVACWRGGLLVGVAPDLLYLQDTDGDGVADVRRTLFTGFGRDASGGGHLNSFRWRIDNRFHIPTGVDGGEIVPVPPGATPAINVSGQHLLLDPLSMTLVATSGGGQHGMSLDDWNLRAFVCGNSEPVNLVMYDGRYLARNPYLAAPAAAVNIAPEGKFTKLLRISPVEPWRVLRTRLRKEGAIPGYDEGGTPSGFFTAATGITVYRGDAWPAEYRGQVFVGEVANNLVYRARLEPDGVGLSAHRADTDAEFLASSDTWFRPVQFANAPDGTLYLIDMRRELIEGAMFLAPPILKHVDVSAGADMGRIYRIAPDGFRSGPPPRLGDLATPDLVKLFEHPNAWHRETASRLIYERQDPAAVAPLRELAADSKSPLARVMALYSLRGLSALEPESVVALLRSAAGPARVHALRLAEMFPDQTEIATAVLAAVDDEDLLVRYQAAFTLGEFSGPGATRGLVQLAVRDGADPWFQLAILSSAGRRRGELLGLLLADRAIRRQPHVGVLMDALVAQIGAARATEDLPLFLGHLDRLTDDPQDRALADRLIKNLVSQQPAVRRLLSGESARKAEALVAEMIHEARARAADETRAPAARADAIRTLAAATLPEVGELFAALLHSRQPQPVQIAALETLARFDEPDVAPLILAAWPGQTPQQRASSMEALLTRPQWTVSFLTAVEEGRIASADVDPARVALLQKHGDPAIRAAAARLFAGVGLARRQDVVATYQQSLELPGDVDRGRLLFRQACAGCHKLEGFGEAIGADLNAIRDRGTAAVLLHILDPNREVKPQFLNYVIVLDSGRTITGMITAETSTSLTIRKADNTTETVLRVDIEELQSTGLSFMPEGLEKQIDTAGMADLLSYLNSIN